RGCLVPGVTWAGEGDGELGRCPPVRGGGEGRPSLGPVGVRWERGGPKGPIPAPISGPNAAKITWRAGGGSEGHPADPFAIERHGTGFGNSSRTPPGNPGLSCSLWCYPAVGGVILHFLVLSGSRAGVIRRNYRISSGSAATH